MKPTGFRGIADVLGQIREVDYNGRSLTLEGLTLGEAYAVIAVVERMQRASHYGEAISAPDVHGTPARALDKAPAGEAARTVAEVDAQGGRGVGRESIERKPLVDATAVDAAAEAESAGRGRKRGQAPGAPPALVNGAAKTNGAHVAGAAGQRLEVAAHVDVEYPEWSVCVDAERDVWVKLAAKEIVEFRQSAPPYLDASWALLLRTAPVGWFKRHLTPPPAPKAAKGDKAASRQAAGEQTAAAHRAVAADVLANAKNDVATAQVAGAAVYPVEVVAEIRAAFGINPALLALAMKEILVDKGVEDGHVPPALAGDVEEGFSALCDNAPAGWFREQASSTKNAAKGSTKPHDPLGLAPEGVDPDADPIAPPRARAVGGVDLAALQALPTFRDVLSYLIDHGVKTQAEMVAMCLKLKKDVSSIDRVADVANRIPRALVTLGIELPA